MKNEQKQLAKDLFLQSALNKTEISKLLNVNRRTIHLWVREGHWDRLKRSALHMPSILAEHCYMIFGALTTSLLDDRRSLDPVTNKEAETMYKLVSTINKLKNRSTTNESMEMFTWFLEGLQKRDTKLADDIRPHIDDYIRQRRDLTFKSFTPPDLTPYHGLPTTNEEAMELNLDQEDIYAWNDKFLEEMEQVENDEKEHEYPYVCENRIEP